MSCEVPDHVQQVLHQLMTLFGEAAPVSSDEVIAIGVQQLGVTSSGEISWDMVRDALIREVTFGGTTCPTEEVCRLMAEFLQRLPLPRLVHFLDMILPQMVPVRPLVSQEGGGLPHPTVSLSALRGVSGMWSIPSTRPSSFGQGRALCM